MFKLSLILALGVFSACKTAEKSASVDKARGEAVLYSTDDNRTAMPDANTSRTYKNVVENLEDEIKKNPRDINHKVSLAQVKMVQGKLDDAEHLCRDTLRLDLKNTDAKKILAQIAFRRGNFDLANIVIQSIDHVAKKDSQMLNILALIALKRNENSEAMAYFKQALQMNPEDVAVRMNLGVLYLKYRQIQSASIQFERVLKTMPSNRDARLHLAIIKTTRGQAAESEKIYADILNEKDNNPLALYNLAVAQKANSKFDKALENLKAYLKTKPVEGSQTNEAFALIEDIQNDKSAAGEPVTDEQIQQMAAKVVDKDEETAESVQPNKPQVATTKPVPVSNTKEAPQPQTAPIKKTSTGADDEISDLENQLK